MRTVAAQRRLPPRARSAGPSIGRRRNVTPHSEGPARAHVWGKQAERSEAVGGSPALGTPETLTDAQGATHNQNFAPFGARREGDTSLTRIGFTSHHQDDDLGFIDMGGRVYDPIAARFTTADPILQAPFSSQGQNRYAYVFNDPINKTDPSGFAWHDMGSTGGNVAWGAGAAAWGGAAIYAAGSASGFSLAGAFAGGAAPATAAPGLGLGVGQTLGMNPFGGSSSGRYSAPVPSGVVNSNPVKMGGTDAVGQSAAPGPAVQERADQLQQSIESFDEAQPDDRLASRRGRPTLRPGGGPVLRPQTSPTWPVTQWVIRPAPGSSFPSHDAFVAWAGRAGNNRQWHHIVEQNQYNVMRFGTRAIHTSGNYANITRSQHEHINRIYNNPWPQLTGSPTQSVREWLRPRDFETHRILGEWVLEMTTPMHR